jgi:hypothetical protein
VQNDDYVVSVGLQWTNRKIVKIVSLYQREMFKNIPRLGTFCTKSVIEGLMREDPSVQWRHAVSTKKIFNDASEKRSAYLFKVQYCKKIINWCISFVRNI